jgi:hypothetical protein
MDSDGIGYLAGQPFKMVGGAVGRLIAPVATGSPDREADRFRSRSNRSVPRFAESLKVPGHA